MAVKLAELQSVIATTLHSYGKKMHDNITTKSVILSEMKRKGLMQPANGGLTIIEDVEYALNPTVDIRPGRAEIPAEDYEFLAQVSFPWCTVDGSILLWDEDKFLNKGDGRLFDFAKSLISNTEKAFTKKFDELMYADGSDVNNGPGFWGLEKVISATNTYGNILGTDGAFAAMNRTSGYAWWRANVEATNMAFEIEGDTGLRHLMNVCSQGDQNEQPDLVIFPQSIWEAVVASLTLQQRFTDKRLADIGFDNFMLGHAACVWDINCPYVDAGAGHYEGTIYVLNMNHLRLRPDSECVDKMIRTEWIRSENFERVRKNLLWRGQMVCPNPRYFGKMTLKSVA